jgi:hypothetical protein
MVATNSVCRDCFLFYLLLFISLISYRQSIIVGSTFVFLFFFLRSHATEGGEGGRGPTFPFEPVQVGGNNRNASGGYPKIVSSSQPNQKKAMTAKRKACKAELDDRIV